MFFPGTEEERHVINAMERQGQREELEKGWGQEFSSLVQYLALATSPEFGWGRLQEVIRVKPVARTMVLTGERCTGDAEDGSDSPIMLGMTRLLGLLGPNATKVPGLARNGREPDALSVIFSGGQLLTRATGELPGSELARQFNTLTEGRYASYVQSEDISLNTGDQGTGLGGLVWARRPERLIVLHVVDHIARFAATVLEGWRANRDGRIAQAERFHLDGYLSAQEVLTVVREYPEIHLIPVGSFDDVDPRRGKYGISRAQEAFGPVQDDDEIVIPGKKLGGEYAANRYGVECLPQHVAKSIGYACRALPPSAMLQLLLTGKL